MVIPSVAKEIYDANGRYKTLLIIVIKNILFLDSNTMADDEEEVGEEENSNNLGVGPFRIFIFFTN
jgi:hypothetical protein